MYRIEGDGSFKHTVIWRDNEQIPYEQCEFRINQEEDCVAVVDGVFGSLDRMLLTSIYMIVSDGKFTNSMLFYMKEILHGVQWLKGIIKQEGHPELLLGTILLPNIIEVIEPPPRKVDERLVTFAEGKPKVK